MDYIQRADAEQIEIRRARCGDHQTFHALVDRHARDVYRLVFRMTGNAGDAKDIVQDTFLKVGKQIGRFDGRATFRTWLHRICTNCSLEQIRARKRKQGLQLDPAIQVAAGAPSPERIAASSEMSAILGPALEELSEMERVAFVLRHYEGLGIEEISVRNFLANT